MPTQPAPSADRVADLVETAQLDGLIDAAGVDGVREILSAFWRSTDGLVADLKRQLVSSDQAAALRSAHALKGSALNVGASRFAETLRRVEEACRAGDLQSASRFASTAEDDYRDTIVAFEDRLRETIRR